MSISLIGRAEKVDFDELALSSVPARIDTGAKTSSIWASNIKEIEGKLSFVLFGQDSDFYTGKILYFSDFDATVVSTSTGQAQKRYVVRILVKLKGKKIRAKFTLADRSTQVYPVLIGRNILRGKFIVDVKQGSVLKVKENDRTKSLKAQTEEKGVKE